MMKYMEISKYINWSQIWDEEVCLQTSLVRLERDTPNFRLAKDYGLLTINDKKVIFYFER
jgi:hypothetical protein